MYTFLNSKFYNMYFSLQQLWFTTKTAPMAPQVSELAATIGFLGFSLLSAAIAALFLYVAGSVASFTVFYLKELIWSTDRPPIAGTVFHQLVYFNTLFDYHTRNIRRHTTFRLIKPGRSEIFTADPANIEHMLKSNFSKYAKGEYNYNVVKDLFGDGIFAVDGERWKHQRKLASYDFSTKVLRDFSSIVFRLNAAKLARKIADAASTTTLFDMQELLMKSTLDSIFKVGFGVELDTLSGSEEIGSRFSKAFDDANQIVFRRYSDIFWELKRRFNIGQEAQLKRNIKVIDDFVFQLIERKRKQMKGGAEDGKDDILSRFIVASEDDPELMNDRYLRDIILNFLIAGKDTSANTLSWFFYMLCKHPWVQEKIVNEITDAMGPTNEMSDVGEFASGLTQQSLDKMQYLHAALTETLRLYPAVPADGKTCEEDDVLPDGFKVKRGDGVNYHAYAMGRMTYLWGEDAEDFRPERWLDKNRTFRPESQFKFVSFHGGPRICLGKDFAYRQMKILAAVLLHSFKFKLVDESKKATYRTMFTLHIADGLPLIASLRK